MPVILFVDDEVAARRVFSEELRKKSYTVLETGSVAEALTTSHEYSIDVVITSALLRSGNGHEVLERTRVRHPRVLALLLSDLPRYDLERRGLLPRGAAFLRKPFTADALYDAIGDLLSTVRARRA